MSPDSDALVDGSDDAGEEGVAQAPVLAQRAKVRRRYLTGLIFVGGVFLGWLLIGWLLWPVSWVNTVPAELHPDFQRVYVGLVAGEYWRNRDLSHVREALAEWDDHALAELMVRMGAEASGLEERQQLATLAEALALPDAEVSFWDVLLEQKAILLGTGLSASVLVVAVLLGVSTMVRPPGAQPGSARGQIGASQIAGEAEMGAPGAEEYGEASDEYEEGDDYEEGDEREGDAQSPDDEMLGGDEGERDGEDYLDFEEEEDEDDIEPEAVGDVIFSFFEEEESILPELEALCKGLPDIEIDDLLNTGKEMVARFEAGLMEPGG